MAAHHPLSHEVERHVTTYLDPAVVPPAAAARLALLVVGILAAQSSVVAQLSRHLRARVVGAVLAESIARRLRRTLSDPHLAPVTCYHPVVRQVIAWPGQYDRRQEVVLIIDESSKTDEIHLFRVSLPDWGGALPLAWAVWAPNVAVAPGDYWRTIDRVLAEVAALIPPGRRVVVVADRAYGVPAFLDRLEALGWSWIVRLTTTGSHKGRDPHHGERDRKAVVTAQLARPGQRFRLTGELFKDAGWRAAHLVGVWGHGQKEALVVLTHRSPRWSVLRTYERRFWIEAGFRTDKATGWQGEASQVQGGAHHQVLLLGMAWATVITRCLGVAEADARWTAMATKPVRLRANQTRSGLPRHARERIFRMGLAALAARLCRSQTGPWRWWLPDIAAPSWADQWYQVQARRFLFTLPVRP